jgi:hypothetical protein
MYLDIFTEKVNAAELYKGAKSCFGMAVVLFHSQHTTSCNSTVYEKVERSKKPMGFGWPRQDSNPFTQKAQKTTSSGRSKVPQPGHAIVNENPLSRIFLPFCAAFGERI